MFRSGDADPSSQHPRSGPHPQSAPWPAGSPTEDSTRQSRGLEQFLSTLYNAPTTAVLDLGGANQNNITYLANLGHRISSENVLHILDSVWFDQDVSEARKIEEFLDQTLNYPEASFGGALVWDTLQYLPAPLLDAVIERLYYLLNPGAMILSYFHAEEKSRAIPNYAYRIVDGKTMLLAPRGLRNREQFFNNRGLERLFQNYSAIKFFLTRDHLREVIVKR